MNTLGSPAKSGNLLFGKASHNGPNSMVNAPLTYDQLQLGSNWGLDGLI